MTETDASLDWEEKLLSWRKRYEDVPDTPADDLLVAGAMHVFNSKVRISFGLHLYPYDQ